MNHEVRKKLVCFLLVGLGGVLFVLAYLNMLGLWGEVVIGTAIIFMTMAAGSVLWGRRGNAALVRHPQPEPEIEEEEDEELKEDILRILLPGVPVDEESNVLKFLMEGGEQSDGEDGFTCAICLDPIVPGDVVVSGASCSHVFHRPCIIQWLMKKRRRRASDEQKHNGCPTCRSPMWTDEDYAKAEAAATAARDNQNKDGQQQNSDQRQQHTTNNEQIDQLGRQTTNEGAVAQPAAARMPPPASAAPTQATNPAATASPAPILGIHNYKVVKGIYSKGFVAK